MHNIEAAAAVVHYDIPSAQNRFASRLLTMKSYFSHHCFQNRVSVLILLSEILLADHLCGKLGKTILVVLVRTFMPVREISGISAKIMEKSC